MEKNDALASDKQVELLRVLTAHREYEKKLLAEIQRVEAQAKDTKLGVQGQLNGLELKVQEGGAYAAHLESERKKLASELQAALAGAEAVEKSKAIISKGSHKREDTSTVPGRVRGLPTSGEEVER